MLMGFQNPLFHKASSGTAYPRLVAIGFFNDHTYPTMFNQGVSNAPLSYWSNNSVTWTGNATTFTDTIGAAEYNYQIPVLGMTNHTIEPYQSNIWMLSDIAYGNGIYLGIGGATTNTVYLDPTANPKSAPVVVKSTNGVDWVSLAPTMDPELVSFSPQTIIFDGTDFVIFGRDWLFSGEIVAKSSDGVAWTTTRLDSQYAPPGTYPHLSQGVKYLNGKYFAYGDYVEPSPDYTSYTMSDVAIPDTPFPQNSSLLTSSDGLAWTPVLRDSTNPESTYVPISTPINNRVPIVYGKGLYVVASQANILVSTDAVTWDFATNPPTPPFTTSNFSRMRGVFVDLIFANNQFVAITNQFDIFVSSDGNNWVSAGANNILSATPTPICSNTINYHNGVYIMTVIDSNGHDFGSNLGTIYAVHKYYMGNKMLYSTDLIYWTESSYTPPENTLMTQWVQNEQNSNDGKSSIWDIVECNGKLFLMVIYPEIYNAIGDPAFDNYRAFSTRLYTLDETTSTTPVTLPRAKINYLYPTALACGGGVWVMSAITVTGRPSFWSSVDGVNWTFRQAIEWTGSCNYNMPTNSAAVFGLAFANDVFVGAFCTDEWTDSNRYSNRSVIVRSTDGVTWDTSAGFLPAGRVVNIVGCNGKFLALGEANAQGGTGQIWVSSDGITWSDDALPVTGSPPQYATMYDAAYGNGMWLAIGNDGTLSYCATSTDAATWTVSEPAAISTIQLYSIAFGNGRFVAVGEQWAVVYTDHNHAVSAVSTDGVNWTTASVTTPTPFDISTFKSVVYSAHDGLFVAVGGKATSGSSVAASVGEPADIVIATSPDGLNWTIIETDQPFGYLTAIESGSVYTPANT